MSEKGKRHSLVPLVPVLAAAAVRRVRGARVMRTACLSALPWLLAATVGHGAEPPAAAIGPVDACQQRSPFIRAMGLADDSRLSTATPGVVGFSILAFDPAAGRIRPLVHPTWTSAGQLGQFTYDAKGNIYVVPVPLTSLEVNPPQDRNKVQIIDGATGRMALFLDLPMPPPNGTTNPFGVIGLDYDCETGSLYVASLAGSTATEQLGTLFQIDVASRRILSRRDGIDVLGVGIFKGSGGKRLYIGSAREPEVSSYALDASGAMQGEPRLEVRLGDLGLPATYRAQKLRFTSQAQLRLKAVPFAYSLRVIAPDETQDRLLRYLPGDRWEPVLSPVP